jgi:protoporphyrin/coproporphyrin ferrochelatase
MEFKAMKKTAVLLIGFGGPERLEEVRPFLKSIVGDSRVPDVRIEEVYRHYEAVGGRSPFNDITERQKRALEAKLKAGGLSVPIGVAYRHSSPSFQDAFETFGRFGVESVIGLVLASFRSFVSREWYYEKLEEGKKLAGAASMPVRYTSPFDVDPLYLRAQTERVRELWDKWTPDEKKATLAIFTAHSIPVSMCQQSCGENENRCYGYQFRQASALIAGSLGIRNWTYCYQSQSGKPGDTWLDPDVKLVIRGIDTARYKRVLLVPVGFLCDNVEVIYDLDHEAKAVAESRGLAYARAATVGDHPLFIEMMANRVLEKVNA